MTIDSQKKIMNPFRPSAGHMPPYLAGREREMDEFKKLLTQEPIMQNAVITGLRGLGKTVLLEKFKPVAIEAGWFWAGTDLSESASVSEEILATRILADLSLVTSTITLSESRQAVGMSPIPVRTEKPLGFQKLAEIFHNTPGLVSDKLKAVLETAWGVIRQVKKRGIIFAYDEAQNMADHKDKSQFPLSLLLDVFQSIQRKGAPFMLVLSGLPTLYPKLVEARTYAERMFHVIMLERLGEQASREAVAKPIEKAKCPVSLVDASLSTIYKITQGYPYFIQYVCHEVFDCWIQRHEVGQPQDSIPVEEIIRKLDADFFAGRWARATDRQRELLWVVSKLDSSESEFTVQEVAALSGKLLDKPFSSSHVNQMLVSLQDAGLIYKNRHGKYSFAVPLMAQFIQRTQGQPPQLKLF